MHGEYSGKIFDTDLSAVAATYTYWRFPGLGLCVAVTERWNAQLAHLQEFGTSHMSHMRLE